TVPSGATDPGNVASFATQIVGTYSVVITNTASGCSSNAANGTVTVNPNPTVTVNSSTICQGQSATVTASPGTSVNYTYVWTVPSGATDPGNVASFATQIAGTYSVVITDTASGCTSNAANGTVTVNQNPSVTVNSSTVCQGQSATVTATPDTTGSYTYVWTVPTGVTNPGNVDSFTTTIAGTYSVIITNTISGCTSTSASGNVTVNPNPTVTISNVSTCNGTNATVTASPGTSGNYTYVWTVPSGATDPGNVASFATQIAGTYSVVITDTASGCSSNAANGTVTVNQNPTVTVNSSTVCQGQSATITATPGTSGTFSYVWTVPNGVTNPGNVASFTTTAAGTYSVVITNTVSGCTSTSSSGNVTVNAAPTVSVSNVSICNGTNATVTATSGATGTYTYVWTVPSGAANPGNVDSFTTTVAGTYSVVITDTASGCSSSSASGSVVFTPSFSFDIESGCQGNNYMLEVKPINGTFDIATAQFNWEIINGTIATPVGTNDATFNVTDYLNSTPLVESLPLTFGVTVTNQDGCTQYNTVVLTSIYCGVQKGISPNGDGLNDYFNLEQMNVKNLGIFNRFGTKVYNKSGYTNQWIGQSDDNNELPDGTYFYVIEFNDNQPTKTGWIYINREVK
ncbi:gliding motility-associated C-terminal domain-containing protein, partial [Flavobacterium sp.]|uniref:T9SS type B sorting domain-containing protein n=1 Tax=Flavobacterium sp. TaxID=239 RepID=UPI002638B47C